MQKLDEFILKSSNWVKTLLIDLNQNCISARMTERPSSKSIFNLMKSNQKILLNGPQN